MVWGGELLPDEGRQREQDGLAPRGELLLVGVRVRGRGRGRGRVRGRSRV